MLTRYVAVSTDQAADTLRLLLLDRAGDVGWDWAHRQRPIDYESFIWLSPAELLHVVNSMPHALSRPMLAQVSEWLGLPEPTGLPRMPPHQPAQRLPRHPHRRPATQPDEGMFH